jgi:hypothetical protein
VTEFERINIKLKALLLTPVVWLGVNIIFFLLFHQLFRTYPWFEEHVEWLLHHPWLS